MGLCKCPKKKVTNLFCFEHRVNVCEHCLVANHSKCIVQSYLKWLQDSDYDSSCTLCSKNLNDGVCVRLMCYDVFHWHCVNAYAKRLPSNTAPAGYQCPRCQTGIFPPSNMASPVAEQLQKYLSQVNWARTGLGLPLIEEPPDTHTDSYHQQIHNHDSSLDSIRDANSTMDDTSFSQFNSIESPPNYSEPNHHPAQEQHSHNQGHGHSHSPSKGHGHSHGDNHSHSNHSQSNGPKECAVNLEAISSFIVTNNSNQQNVSNNRKVYDTTKDYQQLQQQKYVDHDENKYQRRPALQWFARWFSSREDKNKKRPPLSTMKKFLFIIVIGLIGFITLITIFSQLGRASADNDPFLDPMANPNIRVAND